jgi:hypothetical protein
MTRAQHRALAAIAKSAEPWLRWLYPYGLGLRLVWLDRPLGFCPMCGGGPAVHHTSAGCAYCTDHLEFFEIRDGNARGLMRTFGTGKPWGLGPRMMRSVPLDATQAQRREAGA